MSELRLKVSKAPDGRAKIEALIGDDAVAADVIDLWSDVERDRFANAVHATVPALDLLTIQRELLKIDRDNLPLLVGHNDSWPEPASVDRPTVPAFPVDALPEPLRAWVSATAEACQVPADLPGLLSLAACAGAVARRVEVVAGRGWIEPINLYVACLLEPANRKSAVFSAAFRPLREIERELIVNATPDFARRSSARRIKEGRAKKAESQAMGKDGDQQL